MTLGQRLLERTASIRRGNALLAGATVGLAIALVTPLVIWYKHKYPFGHSHCCIGVLAMALENYARDHNGYYAADEESPEAS